LRAEAKRLEAAVAFLREAKRAPAPEGVQIYDPVPHVITRRADYERAQLLVQSASRPALQEFLRAWTGALPPSPANGVRWHLDVDPIEFD
jgi:primosomal protein N' (replication factor Y)